MNRVLTDRLLGNILRMLFGWGIALTGASFVYVLGDGEVSMAATIAALVGSFLIGFGSGGWD